MCPFSAAGALAICAAIQIAAAAPIWALSVSTTSTIQSNPISTATPNSLPIRSHLATTPQDAHIARQLRLQSPSRTSFVTLSIRSHLATTPQDAHIARQLRLQSPNLTSFELAQCIPLSKPHHDLIVWMQNDLIAYHDQHDDVWRRRRRLRDTIPTYGECNRQNVKASLDLYADTVSPGLQHLSLADFHSLVSVFATADYEPSSLARSFTNLSNREHTWDVHSLWPTETFLFTTMKIGFRRMAMSYGLRTHYLGLISHLDTTAAPHGFSMVPGEFLEHDLEHALDAVLHLKDSTEDWAAVHQAFAAMRDAPGRTRLQRQMDDFVYFLQTHESVGSTTGSDLYDYVELPEMEQFLEKIGSQTERPVLLKEAVDRVTRFWIEHAPTSVVVKNLAEQKQTSSTS